MEEFKIVLPLYVDLPRKKVKDKRVRINLNIYRNLNPFTENECKKKYQEIVKELLPKISYEKIEIEFTMFKKFYNKDGTIKKTIIDKSNVYSIATKYFLDALVSAKVIEDDNDLFVKRETINPTEYIENNEEERIEIIVKKWSKI